MQKRKHARDFSVSCFIFFERLSGHRQVTACLWHDSSTCSCAIGLSWPAPQLSSRVSKVQDYLFVGGLVIRSMMVTRLLQHHPPLGCHSGLDRLHLQ